ncbi:hypothetical protein [Paenibacillus sp. YPG26]|uniref:hypothetical protein n=1 Tax=Paenibacillus sp. YPG26 TaxID=2878915 RepID=UPI0020419648|nr:hypothetical protein [Paenibacillus sp. YPG26]USB34344.1 hypothetical protein LDO05_06080 [Paenibacillus sp. YPG26]
MQQFSVVLQELRRWFESFGWYRQLRKYDLHLLFGGLGVGFLYQILILILPYQSTSGLITLFYTVPLLALAHQAFLLGAWLTLTSGNVKYLPYALWLQAVLIIFPFSHISLSNLIPAAVYALLGYFAFKYTASSYASKSGTL